MTGPDSPSAVLVIDSGSPVVSIAFGAPGVTQASRSMSRARSSEALLRGIDEVLREAGATLGDLDGLVALRGPGSFTGLRVGLATALGLHQALQVPATALPTLEVLGRTAGQGAEPVAAVVDALRGEWFVQLFADDESLGKPEILAGSAVAETGAKRVVQHAAEAADSQFGGVDRLLVEELAPRALNLLAKGNIEWSEATLLDPLYLRQPAIHGRG